MATYDLTKKTYGVSGQSKVILGNTNNESGWKRLQNLETKVEEQSDKLDQITSLLNAISEKTSASWNNFWIQVWQYCIKKTDWWFKETIRWCTISY